MSKDKLTICPRCGSDACYEQELGADYKVHQCYGCGFTTNTLMTEDSKFLNEQIEVMETYFPYGKVKESMVKVPIPRTSNGARFRDAYLKIKLKGLKGVLHYVKTLFRISKR